MVRSSPCRACRCVCRRDSSRRRGIPADRSACGYQPVAASKAEMSIAGPAIACRRTLAVFSITTAVVRSHTWAIKAAIRLRATMPTATTTAAASVTPNAGCRHKRAGHPPAARSTTAPPAYPPPTDHAIDTRHAHPDPTATAPRRSPRSRAPCRPAPTPPPAAPPPAGPTPVALPHFQTPLNRQGGRRTCIVFAAVAALEAAYRRAGYGELDLSEQFLNHF